MPTKTVGQRHLDQPVAGADIRSVIQAALDVPEQVREVIAVPGPLHHVGFDSVGQHVVDGRLRFDFDVPLDRPPGCLTEVP